MSKEQSNLSDGQYGYDLVAGTTQSAINVTIKEFLMKLDAQPMVKCYVQCAPSANDTPNYVEIDYAELTEFVGKDPFDIKDEQTDAEYLKKLREKKFAFAFRASMGLPEEFDLADIPDVIQLNQGDQKVTYNLTAGNFQILIMEEASDQEPWINISQGDQAIPWTFQFTVDLDMSENSDAFEHLPDIIKNHVKNLSKSTIFSVQQLYLDLNTVGLESAPKIIGLSETSPAYIYLTRFFVNHYFDNFQSGCTDSTNPQGHYLLGYAIKPTNQVDKSSIIPTDLNFMVSPHVDAKGNPTQIYPLYTLNWLVMTGDHAMVPAAPFKWNWVEESDRSNHQGTMAIKRSIFAQHLNRLLSPSLRQISLAPKVKIEIGPFKGSIQLNANRSPNPGGFKAVPKGKSHVLTFSHSKTAKDKDQWGINWGNAKLRTHANSDVYFEGSTIRVVTTAGAWLHLNICGGVSEGDLVKYQVETKFTLNVDASGQLKVALSDPVFKDLSKFDVSLWAKIVSLGSVDDCIASVKGHLSVMHQFLVDRPARVQSMLNGSRAWVFPGGDTFLFKDPKFSAHQDLTAHVTYAAPTPMTLNL